MDLIYWYNSHSAVPYGPNHLLVQLHTTTQLAWQPSWQKWVKAYDKILPCALHSIHNIRALLLYGIFGARILNGAKRLNISMWSDLRNKLLYRSGINTHTSNSYSDAVGDVKYHLKLPLAFLRRGRSMEYLLSTGTNARLGFYNWHI